MSDHQEQPNVFAFAFAQGGFEAIVNLSKLDQEECLAKLADAPKPHNTPGSVIHYLKLRAQFNQQRRFELWTLGVASGLTEADLWDWATQDPQGLADIIRERGVPQFRPAPSENAVIK